MIIDAATELREDADPLDAFAAAVVRSRARIQRVAADGVAGAVVKALARHAAQSAYLVADLGAHAYGVRDACADAGVEVAAYEELVGDRPRLAAFDAAVTGCAAALAATGSILTTAAVGRGAALVAPLHVCIVEAAQVLPGLTELFRGLPTLGAGSFSALQTGPSRTADIEKVIVIGAHGPRAVEVVLID